MAMSNLFFVPILLYLAIGIYILFLATRFVKAMEKISDKIGDK